MMEQEQHTAAVIANMVVRTEGCFQYHTVRIVNVLMESSLTDYYEIARLLRIFKEKLFSSCPPTIHPPAGFA